VVPPSDWATWEMCCPASEGEFADSLAVVARVRGVYGEMRREPDGRARRARRVKEVVDMLMNVMSFQS